MPQTRRVLIVAYHFPPEPTAGALRPSFLAKYLPEFGWEPTILTRYPGPSVEEPPNVLTASDLLERVGLKKRRDGMGAPAPSENGAASNGHALKRARELLKNIVLFPDRATGWILPALLRAREVTARQAFDAVISTSPPLSTHIVGCLTAKHRGLPWIADYRDLWFSNPYFGADTSRNRRTYALERWLLRHSARVTAVNDHIAAQQRLAFGDLSEATIPNAYDPTEWESLPAGGVDAFNLCYAGMLYDGKRRLDLLFAAVAALRNAGDPVGGAVRFDIYGPDKPIVQALAERFGIADIVGNHGIVSRETAVRAQRRAAVLLIPLRLEPATSAELGSKIFECVGARRPVIAVGPAQSAVRTFIEKHKLGWYGSNAEECARAIREAHAAFLTGALRQDLAASDGIGTARELARRFAEQLDSLVPSATERKAEVLTENR